METGLRNEAEDVIWKNAVRASITQKVFLANAETLNTDLEMNQFYAKYKNDGSEIEDLEQAKLSLTQSEEKLEDVLTQADNTCKLHANELVTS